MFLRKSELGREVITQHGIEGAGSVLLPTPTSMLHPLIITFGIIVESQSTLYPKRRIINFVCKLAKNDFRTKVSDLFLDIFSIIRADD